MVVSDKASTYRFLRREALRAAASAVLATTIAAGGAVVVLGLSPLAILRSLAVLGALLALTVRHLADHGQRRLGPANHLTLVRAVLVALLAALVAEPGAVGRWPLALGGALAFGLDGVDGWLARRTGTASPFGARLDMELDGLFVLVLGGLAITFAGAGPWVLAAGLARYAFIGAAAVWPFMARPLPPTPRRARACGIGVGLLVGCLAPVGPALSVLCAALGAAAIVGSFAIDVAWLVRHRSDGPW